MNLIFLYIIAGIMALLCLIAIGFYILNRFREMEEPENEIIIEHYMPQYSGGHTDGVVQSMEIGEKRIKIVFLPRDINYIKEFKIDKKLTIKPYTLFFDKRQVDSLPQGDLSMHRNKLKAYPNDITLLPEELKRKRIGKMIMKMIDENNKLSDESELMQKRMDNLRRIASQTFGGEIFVKYSDKMKDLMKDVSESIEKKEKDFTKK